jgi:hypothetical protein
MKLIKFLFISTLLILTSCKYVEEPTVEKDSELVLSIKERIAKGEIKPIVSYLNNSGIDRWGCDSIIIDVVSESGYDNFLAHLTIGGEEIHLTDDENESIVNAILIKKENFNKKFSY